MWAGICAVVAAVVLIDIPVIDRLRVRNQSYEVGPQAVKIRRRMLFPQDTILPTKQILSIRIVQGPLLLRFGLAKVEFVTIGEIEPLGPVTFSKATRIRAVAQPQVRGENNE